MDLRLLWSQHVIIFHPYGNTPKGDNTAVKTEMRGMWGASVAPSEISLALAGPLVRVEPSATTPDRTCISKSPVCHRFLQTTGLESFFFLVPAMLELGAMMEGKNCSPCRRCWSSGRASKHLHGAARRCRSLLSGRWADRAKGSSGGGTTIRDNNAR